MKMWGYYGSKSKIIDKYPAPTTDTIVEPFAGTAQYGLKYFDREVILVEKYDVIARLWRWLQTCSKKDILDLPRLKCGQSIDDYQWDCDEAKWLVGFIITGAPTQPKKTASKWKTVIRPNTQNYKLELIANNLDRIRHWKVIEGDYTQAPDIRATWFVDPPYQNGGQYYRHSNKNISYEKLASWCLERKGQLIVCENSKATWLPFKHLTHMRGIKFKTTECVYTNSIEKSLFN